MPKQERIFNHMNKKEEIRNRTKDQKKAIKIYTIELLVFSLVFVTLGVLMLVGVLGKTTGFRQVFTYVTLAGAALIVGDLIWALASKKRRQRVSLVDKFIIIPAPIAIVILDIFTLVNGVDAMVEIHRLVVGIVFCYIAAVYVFEAVYHYYFPLKELMEAAEEDEEEEEEKQEEPKKEEEDDR